MKLVRGVAFRSHSRIIKLAASAVPWYSAMTWFEHDDARVWVQLPLFFFTQTTFSFLIFSIRRTRGPSCTVVLCWTNRTTLSRCAGVQSARWRPAELFMVNKTFEFVVPALRERGELLCWSTLLKRTQTRTKWSRLVPQQQQHSNRTLSAHSSALWLSIGLCVGAADRHFSTYLIGKSFKSSFTPRRCVESHSSLKETMMLVL